MSIPITTFLVVAALVTLWIVVTMARMDREMFEDGTGVEADTYEDPVDIYDDFYAKVYDKLFSTPERISFERASIRENALNLFSKPETKFLDVCCGTSPHAGWLCEDGYEVVGIDQSESMLKKARAACPSGRFYRGDVMNPSSFPPKSFSHALMLYFSAYQFRNPKIVFDNIYLWLKPGSMFVVHLVDPDKFDPILSAASPFPAFSMQKYSKSRVTESDIFFDQFKYRAKFIKDRADDNAIFEETFTFQEDSEQKVREHKHRLTMPALPEMIDLIRASGFTVQEQVDMTSIGYEYQYLVYFNK